MSEEQKTLKSCYILDRLREWFELYGNQNHQRAEEELHLAIDELYEYQQKDQQLADLETKLKESENKFIVANNLRKNSDEVLLNYKTKKYGLDKTIQELRKMKLSLPEKEWYYKGFENCERRMSSHIADLTLEVKELKQQLKEKEKEIETILKENEELVIKHNVYNWGDKIQKDKVYSLTGEALELLINRQNQKAVEQLEKVKEFVNEIYGEYSASVTTNFIDNQINELKGE